MNLVSFNIMTMPKAKKVTKKKDCDDILDDTNIADIHTSKKM